MARERFPVVHFQRNVGDIGREVPKRVRRVIFPDDFGLYQKIFRIRRSGARGRVCLISAEE